MRGETLAQRPAFLPLSFWFWILVVLWVLCFGFFFFCSSFPLSPHRLLAVIFVFIEDAFGVLLLLLLLLSITRQPISFAGLLTQRSPATPEAPNTPNLLPVRPPLHLPE